MLGVCRDAAKAGLNQWNPKKGCEDYKAGGNSPAEFTRRRLEVLGTLLTLTLLVVAALGIGRVIPCGSTVGFAALGLGLGKIALDCYKAGKISDKKLDIAIGLILVVIGGIAGAGHLTAPQAGVGILAALVLGRCTMSCGASLTEAKKAHRSLKENGNAAHRNGGHEDTLLDEGGTQTEPQAQPAGSS